MSVADKPSLPPRPAAGCFRRPWRVTLFSLAVLLFGSGLNLARAAWAWRQADVLDSLPVNTAMPMEVLATTSLFWSVVFGACAVGLWRLRPWGRRGMLTAITLYHAYIWFNHVVFDRSDCARQIWPFAIIHSAVMLLVVWGYLWWPHVRRLYQTEGSKNEPGPENSTPT